MNWTQEEYDAFMRKHPDRVKALDQRQATTALVTPQESPKAVKGADRAEAQAEKAIQDEIARYLDLHCDELTYIRPRMDKPSTIRKGWPDFSIFGGEKYLLIEVKVPGKGLSPDQVAVHRDIGKACPLPAMCFDSAYAITLIKDHFGI